MYEAARGNLLHRVSKERGEKAAKAAKEAKEAEAKEETRSSRLFVEEGATKYFRRLHFSPDGAFLIAPG